VFRDLVLLFLCNRLDLLRPSELRLDGHVIRVIGKNLTNDTGLGLKVSALLLLELREPPFRGRSRFSIVI
jgi:hypothetical protein